MNRYLALGYLALVVGVLFVGAKISEESKPAPKACPTCPTVPIPDSPVKPWGTSGASVDAKGPDGTEPEWDYPPEQWIANIGSHKDNKGMCVFSAMEMQFRAHGMEEFRGFRDWCAQNYGGGGYPEKLQRLIEAYCRAKKIPVPKLYQYEGGDLSIIERVLRSGRFSGVTLYHSKHYGGRIYHAVNCAHASGPRFYAVCDNNKMRGHPMPPYEWFDGLDAFRHAISLNGTYWAYWIDRPGLPPPPKN